MLASAALNVKRVTSYHLIRFDIWCYYLTTFYTSVGLESVWPLGTLGLLQLINTQTTEVF